MKSMNTIQEFAKLIKSRPGCDITFSFMEDGVEYYMKRTREFGLIFGVPGVSRSLLSIPGVDDYDAEELEDNLDSVLSFLANKNSEDYDKDNIKLIAITSKLY